MPPAQSDARHSRPTDRTPVRPNRFLLVYFSLTHAHTQDSEVMSIIRLIAGTCPITQQIRNFSTYNLLVLAMSVCMVLMYLHRIHVYQAAIALLLTKSPSLRPGMPENCSPTPRKWDWMVKIWLSFRVELNPLAPPW